MRSTFSIPAEFSRAKQLLLEKRLEKIDLERLPVTESETEMLRLVTAETKKPFDLTRDLMIRAILVRLEENHHVLAVTMHHIASDAWSLGVFYEELSQLYEARL